MSSTFFESGQNMSQHLRGQVLIRCIERVWIHQLCVWNLQTMFLNWNLYKPTMISLSKYLLTGVCNSWTLGLKSTTLFFNWNFYKPTMLSLSWYLLTGLCISWTLGLKFTNDVLQLKLKQINNDIIMKVSIDRVLQLMNTTRDVWNFIWNFHNQVTTSSPTYLLKMFWGFNNLHIETWHLQFSNKQHQGALG